MRHAMWATLAVAAMMHGTARAELVLGFGGNTQPQITTPAGNTQGFINFAVFDTAGGSVGDHFGTGLAGIDPVLATAGFDTASRYLYLFQAVNVGADIASGSVHVDAAAVTGDGSLAGITYSQVTAVRPFLGTVAAAPGNISGAITDGDQAEATALGAGGLVTPTLLTLNTASLVATFAPAITGDGTRSSLWGYTSDLAPSYTLGSIQDSGVAANGTVPGNLVVPEPHGMLLVLIGSALVIRAGRRRGRGRP